MTDAPQTHWHGIPRKEIPWFPTSDEDACLGCGLCRKVCGRAVFATADGKAEIVAPYRCAVGCSTCAAVCPAGAIRLPDPEVVQRAERENLIYLLLQKPSRMRSGTRDALKARVNAEASLAELCTRSKVQVAGPCTGQQILEQLADLIAEHPVDVLDLRLHIPTLKGLREGTPSFLSFEVASTQQEDLRAFFPNLLEWIHRNGLVLIRQANG